MCHFNALFEIHDNKPVLGPTLCFKDLGQQVLVRFLAHFLKSPKCLVASTTGDTGPAALNAVKSLNSDNLRLVVAHPYGQISEFQRRQMTTIPKVNHKVSNYKAAQVGLFV